MQDSFPKLQYQIRSFEATNEVVVPSEISCSEKSYEYYFRDVKGEFGEVDECYPLYGLVSRRRIAVLEALYTDRAAFFKDLVEQITYLVGEDIHYHTFFTYIDLHSNPSLLTYGDPAYDDFAYGLVKLEKEYGLYQPFADPGYDYKEEIRGQIKRAESID